MCAFIFTNGTILTMDANVPSAEAIGVRDGTIVCAGALPDVQAVMGKAELRDLAGATLLPGFIDGHSHFPAGGMNRLFGVDAAVQDLEELGDRLAARARECRPGEWVIGYGFDDQFVNGKRQPTVRELDAACPDVPVFMRHVTGHTGYANSMALRLAGITRDTPNPPGGLIGHDPSGEPDGVLEGIPCAAARHGRHEKSPAGGKPGVRRRRNHHGAGRAGVFSHGCGNGVRRYGLLSAMRPGRFPALAHGAVRPGQQP